MSEKATDTATSDECVRVWDTKIAAAVAALMDGIRELLTLRAAVASKPAAEDRDDAADRLLTVKEVAAVLGEKSAWVRAHQHELPRVQMPGRLVRFSAKKLERWMERRTR